MGNTGAWDVLVQMRIGIVVREIEVVACVS